jgi:hypothetical protein
MVGAVGIKPTTAGLKVRLPKSHYSISCEHLQIYGDTQRFVWVRLVFNLWKYDPNSGR